MKRILVVEDNEVNSRMIRRRLEKWGYEVGVVENGDLGVRCTYHHQPDLVLMDMSLPIKDGWTATRELKSMSQTSEIPIIALTAHAMEEDRLKAMECGCDGFLTKPIDFEKLINSLKHFFGEDKASEK